MMHAIYQGKLWDVGDRLDVCELIGDRFDHPETITVDFGAEGLIIDPTDGEMEAHRAEVGGDCIDMRPDAAGRYTSRALGEGE